MLHKDQTHCNRIRQFYFLPSSFPGTSNSCCPELLLPNVDRLNGEKRNPNKSRKRKSENRSTILLHIPTKKNSTKTISGVASSLSWVVPSRARTGELSTCGAPIAPIVVVVVGMGALVKWFIIIPRVQFSTLNRARKILRLLRVRVSVF